MNLEAMTLVLAVLLAGPAATVACWRIWPRGGRWSGARLLDAIWTVVPVVLLAGLFVLVAQA